MHTAVRYLLTSWHCLDQVLDAAVSVWHGVLPFCIVHCKLMICIQTYALHAAI